MPDVFVRASVEVDGKLVFEFARRVSVDRAQSFDVPWGPNVNPDPLPCAQVTAPRVVALHVGGAQAVSVYTGPAHADAMGIDGGGLVLVVGETLAPAGVDVFASAAAAIDGLVAGGSV